VPLEIFLAVFSTVFVTEMVGDKSLYTISALASRFHALPVLAGIAVAYMGKMGVAVLLGSTLTLIPVFLLTLVNAFTLLLAGLLVWSEREEAVPSPMPSGRHARAFAGTFGALFFSEWADVGQIVTGTLEAHYRAPVVVWSAATLALCTKGLLALAFGRTLRRFLPQRPLRYLAVAVCLVMAVAAALRIEL
jgi:Ca2+/H+ antiporter, TMEM165/GDT1 family